jgi:uncharacterized protein YrrD
LAVAGHEEDSVVDVTIGAHVSDTHGRKAGDLTTVVIDPQTRAVTHVVVSKGWLLPRDKVVPVEALEPVPPDAFRLRLDEQQIAQLPDFYTYHYVTPDADDAPSATYGPSSYLYQPMVPAAGVGWLMPYPDPAATLPVATGTNVPPGSVELTEGMPIWAEDEQVGTLAGVRVHPRTEQVSHLIISHGWVFHTEQVVARSTIRAIDERGIQLNLTRDAVRDLKPSTPA